VARHQRSPRGKAEARLPRAVELGLIGPITYPYKGERPWRSKVPQLLVPLMLAALSLGLAIYEKGFTLLVLATAGLTLLAAYVVGRQVRSLERQYRKDAPDHSLNRGITEYERGQVSEAISTFSTLAKKGTPEVAAQASANLGLLLKVKGDKDGAKQAFQRTIAASTNIPLKHVRELQATDLRIIDALETFDQLNINELASAALVTPTNLTKALDRLCKLGVVDSSFRANGRMVYELANSIPQGT
jgi:tetratricopeptide (TPR) repeat protein